MQDTIGEFSHREPSGQERFSNYKKSFLGGINEIRPPGTKGIDLLIEPGRPFPPFSVEGIDRRIIADEGTLVIRDDEPQSDLIERIRPSPR